MDFITIMPKSEGKNSIMVVVDRLRYYAHFSYVSHPFKVSILVKKNHGNIS
jgi:hypothetical protein